MADLNIIECPFCHQFLTDPLVLPCFHTFCRRCIERMCSSGQPTEELLASVTCHVCKKICNASELRKNSFMQTLLKLGALWNMPVCQACLLRHEPNQEVDVPPGTHYCWDCQEKYCETCSVGHRSSKGVSHAVIKLDDESQLKKIYSRYENCCVHQTEKNSLCCVECRIDMCQACRDDIHKSHQYWELNSFAQEYSNKLRNDLTKQRDTPADDITQNTNQPPEGHGNRHQPNVESAEASLSPRTPVRERPRLIECLSTRNDSGYSGEVLGIAALKDRIYVVTYDSNTIKVFLTSSPFYRLQDIVVDGMLRVRDIVSSSDTGLVYCAGYTIRSMTGCIWKLDACERKPAKFIPNANTVHQLWPHALSATGQRLLLTSWSPFKCNSLIHYRSDGSEIRTITLPDDVDPQHAVETPKGTFLVARTGKRRRLANAESVGEFNIEGRLIREYAIVDGSVNLIYPWYLEMIHDGRILVSEFNERRITVLDSDWQNGKVLLNVEDGLEDVPQRVRYHNNLLFAGEKSGWIRIFEPRPLFGGRITPFAPS